MKTKRIPLTVPEQEYSRLKNEADLAEKSMNRYVLGLLERRKVVIVPYARELYFEVYRIRADLQRLKGCDSADVQALTRRVEWLCRFCDIFLGHLTKDIS